MEQLPDKRYTLTLSLPVGADIHYKYTLGDGFWNAEHNLDGSFRLRQLIVPPETLLVEDTVDTWRAGDTNDIIFDVNVPADTPAEDFVALQLNPLFGWTEPIPMWKLSHDRWAYILYSPRNLPGNLSYRYCRNGQCGFADDAETPGLYGAGRQAPTGEGPQTQSDQVEAWADWSGVAATTLPAVETVAREGFGIGNETIPAYHPSWRALFPEALDDMRRMNAGWLVLSPTWSYGRRAPGNNPPILAPLPGSDALWPDLLEMISQAQAKDLNVVVYPQPRFAVPVDDWWAEAPREDPGWWPVWFAEYRTFVLHYAELADQSKAQALILGGDWLAPALPDGKLADGSASGVPADAEKRWRDLFAEVRSRFGGQLIWSTSNTGIETPPSFLDAVDQIYLTLTLDAGESFSSILGMDLGGWLDGVAWPAQLLAAKPLVLAVELPADPDLQVQVNLYHTALSAAAERDWVSGFIARGYYPPAALKDASPSVHGKPAGDLLQAWFTTLSGK
jgi:Glycoside Hydrolase Family 113